MLERQRKILLLSGPQHYDEKRPLTGYFRRQMEYLNPLGIAIVAAISRKYGLEPVWREMYPNQVSQLAGLMEKADGVFISSRHFDIDLSREAIDLANKAGIPSIVGGYGPTFSQELFGDTTVVKGEFEPVANQLMDDFLTNRLGPVYDATKLPLTDISREYIWPDRDIFPNTQNRWARHPQEWQRGCSNFCSFCCPTRMQGGIENGKIKSIRERNVADIIHELESMCLDKSGVLFLVNLNTSTIKREMLSELFDYLKKNNIRWVAEGTAAPLLDDLDQNGEDDSLLKKMSPLNGGGGCWSFHYGADDLVVDKVKGSFDKEIGILQRAVGIFRRFGIPLNLSVLVGLDNHYYPQSFYSIRQTLENLRPPYSFLHLATPYPGTPWGEAISREGRLLEGVGSISLNHRVVVHRPKHMTPEELQQGYYWLLRTINNPANMIRTVSRNTDWRLFAQNPLLGMIGTGTPWSMETYLSTQELRLGRYINDSTQRELDGGYLDWLTKSS